MQPSSYCAAQPFSGKHGYQRHNNDCTGGEDDGGPGEQKRPGKEPADQQFNGNTQDRDFREHIERRCQEGRGNLSAQGGQQDGQHRDHRSDGQGQLVEPAGAGSVKGDQVFVKSDGKPVKQQGNINGKLGIDKNRNGHYPEDNAYPNHIQRPGAAVEHQQVQKPAGGSGSDEYQRVENGSHNLYTFIISTS